MKYKMTKLQKEVVGLLLILVFAAGIFTYQSSHPENQYPGMIRLHVIANSDTPEDQMIKKQVRNEMLKAMEGQDSLEEARAYIDNHLEEMEETSEAVLRKYGVTYQAEAERTVTFIPEKTYEDLTLPAGNYEALRVTLGEGKGQNWWCVIFPQLCLIGEKSDGEKLILKSKIKEMLKKELSQK